MILKGTFTSIWDTDVEITTPAELDTETGEVSAESVDAGDVDILEEEYFTDEQGNQYPVCPECHEYILVTSMEDGIGHNLDEVKRCKNPDCDYCKNV
jgi:hypothetical protein